MAYVYEFEVFQEDGWLMSLPFDDIKGWGQGKDAQELAESVTDLVRINAEMNALDGTPMPTPTFGNKPTHGGNIILVAVDAGLHTIPRMTAAQAARALGVSPSRVSHMIKKGQLTAFKYGHNTWVSKYSVETILSNQRHAGRPKKERDAIENEPHVLDLSVTEDIGDNISYNEHADEEAAEQIRLASQNVQDAKEA